MWFDVVTSVEMWCLPYKVLLRDTLTSSTLCRATCGMQNAMELRYSCLIFATQENVQYNARSNGSHLSTSSNIVRARANKSDTPPPPPPPPPTVAPPATKIGTTMCDKASFTFGDDLTTMRPWNCKTEPVRSQSSLSALGNPFCMEKCNASRSNVGPGTKSDAPTSPNVAPATKCEMWRMCDGSEVSDCDVSGGSEVSDCDVSDGSDVWCESCKWCEWCVRCEWWWDVTMLKFRNSEFSQL